MALRNAPLSLFLFLSFPFLFVLPIFRFKQTCINFKKKASENSCAI